MLDSAGDKPSPPSWLGRQPLRLLLIAGLVTAMLAMAEEGWHAFRTHRAEPGAGACWIWTSDLPEKGEPRSFFVSRDFELDLLPSKAWLSIAADEAYVLFINGQLIGANVYRPSAANDLYRVEGFLHQGRNRLVVEARSMRGIGGLLASLRFEEPDRVVLKSDDSWRIFSRFEPGIFDPALPLPKGSPPKIWGRPPTGRWRVEASARERPVISSVSHNLAVLSMKGWNPGARWVDMTRPRHRFPRLGRALFFDWQDEVTGYLQLALEPSEPKVGLIYCDSQLPDPKRRSADMVVLPVAGSPNWTDVELRRFRYCLTVGIALTARPYVAIVQGDQTRRLDTPPADRLGVFDLVPLAKEPLDEQVWQRIKAERRAERERRRKADE